MDREKQQEGDNASWDGRRARAVALTAGCAVVLLVAVSPPETACADGEPVLLATTVVTATRRAEEIMESPVAISVVEGDRIDRRPASTIADLLREVPGVFVTDNTVAGMPRLRIRGEDARRGLVLIDGQEISDHSTFGPGLMIDPSFIERIEVVRGPHSTLYGSRAAGGVINILTRQAPRNAVEGRAGSAWTGSSDGYRADAQLAVAHSGAWARLGVAGTDNGDLHIPSGQLDDTANEALSLMAQAGWKGDSHDVRLVYDRHDLESRAATPEDLVDGFRISKFLLDLPRRDREKVGLFYDGWRILPGLEQIHFDVFRQTIDRRLTQEIAGVVLPPSTPPVFYDFANDDSDTITTLGLNFHTEWHPHEAHKLVFGLHWIDDDLDKTVDRSGTTMRGPVVTPADVTLTTTAGISTVALFAQDTWRVADGWEITGGLRWYRVESELRRSNDPALVPRSDEDRRVVGSAALVWRPLEELALRASWGQGYVYPTLLHLHTGSLFGQGNITRPNPNLSPETSDNREVGVRWQDEVLSVDAAVFWNVAEDYIAAVPASEAPEAGWAPGERTFTNLDGAETWGAELFTSLRIPRTPLEAYGVLTWIHRRLEFATFSTSNAGIPPWSGRLGMRHEQPLGTRLLGYLDGWVAVGGESKEKTARSMTTADGWATLNLAAGIEWKHGWLGVELLNLADADYRPTTDELNQPGRHLAVGARLEF